MPRGASPKREHEYQELKKEFKKEGRYKGRAEEVAARIVNKQRAEQGETKGAKQRSGAGKSSSPSAAKGRSKNGKSEERDLPIQNYQTLTVPEVKARLKTLSKRDLAKIMRYEAHHKNRKTLITEIQRGAA